MRIPAFALALCLLAFPAHADEVHLKNGDRITGITASLAGGTLVFKATGGDLRLAWADVTSLSIDKPMLVTVGGAAPVAATFAGADASGTVTLVPGGPVSLASIVALTAPAPSWQVAGGASAGIVNTSGNSDVKNLRISGDIAMKGAADRYSLTGIATHADNSGVEQARNWTTTGKYDRFISKRMFANATADFTNDRFRDIDLRTALGVGLGYQVLQMARTTLTTDAGAAWVKENFKTIADDS
jgi:putative salt-induced outer membrane protein YdiY